MITEADRVELIPARPTPDAEGGEHVDDAVAVFAHPPLALVSAGELVALDLEPEDFIRLG